jgi:hypothetical protein
MSVIGRSARIMLIASAVMLVGVVPAQGVASRTSVIGTSSYEYNGVASSGYLAWTVWTGKKNLVYGKASGSRFRVNASKTQGWVGGLDGSTLVYQQYSPGRSVSDIYTYDLATKTGASPAIGCCSLGGSVPRIARSTSTTRTRRRSGCSPRRLAATAS